MPLTKLDPNSALILIDLQKGIVAMPTAHPAAEIVSRSAQLARAFRERHLPLVLVHVTGRPAGRTDAVIPNVARPADWTEFVPELDQQPTDFVVTKKCLGAFTGTPLDGYLRERGVTQVVIAGISTSVGVESTARSAYDLGYNVTLVVDAVTDREADAHRLTIEKIFPRLAEVGTTTDVLKLLAERKA